MNPKLKPYANYLETLSGNILLGCDGFVDETYEIVEERKSQTEYSTIPKLKQFGELLVERADGGVGVELVWKRRCEGGCGINTGRIPACLGIKPVLPGLYGDKAIDSAFAAFNDSCELLSLGDPALTIALEFPDGKVLMSDIKAVSSLSWKDVETRIGVDKLKAICADLDILGLGYWSLTANFDAIFEGFMAICAGDNPPKRMFFDFADIKKKSSEAFMKTLALIRQHNDRIPATFSLNEHEVFELFSRIGVEHPPLEPQAIGAALAEARRKIGFDELVVHTPEFGAASSATEGEAFAIQERQTKVVRLAGAGDSFNGGYLSASLGDLTLKQRLVVANAATAFFVTQATGPDRAQLLEQIGKASDI